MKRRGDAVVRCDGAQVAAPGLKWSMLFPMGVRHRADYPGGKVDFNAEFFAALVANWKRNGAQPLPVDFFHRGGSVDGDGNSVEDKVAAGWMVDFEARADGLYALTEWTARAKPLIEAGELRYLSPTLMLNPVDPITGKREGPRLLGAGLLNDPFFSDMPRVAASTPGGMPNGDDMDRAKWCSLLGLPPEATDEQMEQALAALKAPQPPAPEAVEAAVKQAVTAAATVHKSQVDELVTKNAALAADLEALRAERQAAALDAVLLRHSGRIHPEQRENARTVLKALGLEAGEALLASWPLQAAAKHATELGVAGSEGVTNPLEAARRMDALVTEYVKTNGVSRSVARDAVMQKHPDLNR